MKDDPGRSKVEDASGDGPDRLLEHEYDGIREYDNRLPNWWQYTLYGSIVFAVVYWLVFHTYQVVPLPLGQYAREMAAAAEAQLARMEGQGLTDQSLALMAQVPERTSRGRKHFEQFCVVCHGTKGEGNVGPNLTDDYWIHGNRPLQILATVTDGVPEKGMAAWGGQLGPSRVQDVVAFVLTIGGTRIPGKDPQGELLGPPPLEGLDPPIAPNSAPGVVPADPGGSLSPERENEAEGSDLGIWPPESALAPVESASREDLPR